MPPWNWKDYDDAKLELGILRSDVERCSSETPKQSLKVREDIDYLFEHSDQEEDDMERDRELSKELDDAVEQFRKCSCHKPISNK